LQLYSIETTSGFQGFMEERLNLNNFWRQDIRASSAPDLFRRHCNMDLFPFRIPKSDIRIHEKKKVRECAKNRIQLKGCIQWCSIPNTYIDPR